MSKKKKRKREARLWEDTVVMAIRDFQWINFFQNDLDVDVRNKKDQPMPENAVKISRTPMGMIKLDGRAESKLGDVALAAGEKLFLIEVKPSQDQFRDEWQKKGRYAPKILYKTLASLTEFFSNSSLVEGFIERSSTSPIGDTAIIEPTTSTGDIEAIEPTTDALLHLSLRGHMMAFWKPELDPIKDPGQIMILPYISAVALSAGIVDMTRSDIIRPSPFKVTITSGSKTIQNGLFSPLDALWDSDAKVRLSSKKPINGSSKSFGEGPLGLDPREFQIYVNWLIKKAQREGGLPFEPINIIALSSEGRFFQWISSTDRLAELGGLKFTQLPVFASLARRSRFRR